MIVSQIYARDAVYTNGSGGVSVYSNASSTDLVEQHVIAVNYIVDMLEAISHAVAMGSGSGVVGFVLQSGGQVSRFESMDIEQFVETSVETLAVSPYAVYRLDGTPTCRVRYELNAVAARYIPQKVFLQHESTAQVTINGIVYNGRRVVDLGRGLNLAQADVLVEFQDPSPYLGATLLVRTTTRGWRRR